MAFWLARCGIVAIDPIRKSNHYLTSGTLHAPTGHVGQLNVSTVRVYCWFEELLLARSLSTGSVNLRDTLAQAPQYLFGSLAVSSGVQHGL